MTNKQIILIDGSSFIFRAFYAVRDLTAPDGTPTNAIYGVVNMIKQMQRKYLTPYWVCVFDAKGKTFRDDLYPAYKATRKETPSELKLQIPIIHEIIQDLGIPVIVQDGVEADDVIATIATYYAKLDYQILVATGDKDFAQIVNSNITLLNTMTNELLDIDGVIKKFGVNPEQIIDYLTLIGDTVDNVPGVEKCGPKTAVKWLKQYTTLDNIIHNHENITGIVGENFQKALAWLPLSKQLITIDTNVTIDNFSIEDINHLTVKDLNINKLTEAFKKYNFRTWLKELEKKPQLVNATTEILPTQATTRLTTSLIHIDKIDNLKTVVAEIIASNATIAIQLINQNYTDNASAIAAVIVETVNARYTWQLIYATNNSEDLFAENTSDEFYLITKNILESKLNKIVYDYKNFISQCINLKIALNHVISDIKLLHYIKNSNLKHDLSSIINNSLNSEIKSLPEIFGKGASIKFYSQLTTDEQNEFLDNSSNIFNAHNVLVNQLTLEELHLANSIELAISRILFELEQDGIMLDVHKLKLLEKLVAADVTNFENKIYAESSQVFNLNSPKQLQDILFNTMGLPTDNIRKIASGYSTDEESLNTLADQGIGIANLLLEYRSLAKLLNTYITKLPNYLDNNNYIHTSFEQTIVTSGRLSSKDPNLQNIPVRNLYGQRIRECFIPSMGNTLICADYSQIELRILAHISKDSNLIQAFHNNVDIHSLTASQIFNKELADITKEERRYAKSINFGLIYGKSTFGLAKELKIERSAAKLYIDNYFARFPNVKNYMDEIKQTAHNNGYVSTVLGRKIYLPNINNKNRILSQADERLALNAPMQGSAADLIKIAMINIKQWMIENKLASKMILQVHDELIFDVIPAEQDIILLNIPKLMASAYNLAVPLIVEIKAADNWNNAH